MYLKYQRNFITFAIMKEAIRYYFWKELPAQNYNETILEKLHGITIS